MNKELLEELLGAIPSGEYHVVFVSSPSPTAVEIWELSNDARPSRVHSGLDKRKLATIAIDHKLTQRQAAALGALFARSKLLAKENLFLYNENFALAAWQCVYLDGVTGLTSDDHGNSYCSMAQKNKELEERNKELVAALKAAQNVFIEYAEMHAAKPDLEKAKRNYEHALNIANVIRGD
jgi:hypothetical protein